MSGQDEQIKAALVDLYAYCNHLGLGNPVMRKAHDALAVADAVQGQSDGGRRLVDLDAVMWWLDDNDAEIVRGGFPRPASTIMRLEFGGSASSEGVVS